jgi:peptidoglycan/xylan/chitin deacetylase (PgdA/CDA1 family)
MLKLTFSMIAFSLLVQTQSYAQVEEGTQEAIRVEDLEAAQEIPHEITQNAMQKIVQETPAPAIQPEEFQLPSKLITIPMPISDFKPKTIGGMGKNEIAITVDDGPTPETTPKILEIFRKHGVKATFFLVGHNVEKHPELVKMILDEGHSVANHTWTHPKMDKVIAGTYIDPKFYDSKIGKVNAAKEIDTTSEILKKAVEDMERQGDTENAVIQPFFRFPFGAGCNDTGLQSILKERGLANFFWSMSSHDSRTQDPAVALKVSIGMLDGIDYMSKKPDGSYTKVPNYGIFLVHETHPAGLAMLPKFLEELNRRHYTTVYYRAQK